MYPNGATTDDIWLLFSHYSPVFRYSKFFDPCSNLVDDEKLEPVSPCLEGIPVELLNLIIKFLPLSSKASLTLCTKKILQKAGTQHLDNINKQILRFWHHPWDGNLVDRMYFTSRQLECGLFCLMLDGDILDLIYCYYCMKLHRVEESRSRERAPSDGARLYEYAGRPRHLYTDFTFARARRLMKHHRAGKDCTAFLKEFNLSWRNSRSYENGAYQ
jgi:hypothetical protein